MEFKRCFIKETPSFGNSINPGFKHPHSVEGGGLKFCSGGGREDTDPLAAFDFLNAECFGF